MKKKILTTLSVVLVLGLAALGILAYLSDTDSDVNVMTLGNVQIDQIEQERKDATLLPTEDNLKEFSSKIDSKVKKPLYPAVFEGSSIPWNTASAANEAWKVVENNSNVVDKFVTVKNSGKSDAYIRTIIAYEGDATYGPEGAWIHVVHNSTNVNPAIAVECIGTVNIEDVDYTVYEYVYPTALASGETSIPSLKQVYMNKNATNEVVTTYGEEYEIKVLSQAVQTKGFANAKEALDTAFGDVTPANVKEWFSLRIDFTITEKTAFEDVAAAFAEGGNIYISENVDLTNPASGNTYISTDKDVNIYAAEGAEITFKEVTLFNGKGTTTVYDGDLKTNYELCVTGDAKLIIEGGEHSFGAFSATGNGSIEVNGGVLNCRGTYAGVMGISFGENGSLVVNDGTLNMYEPFNLNANRCDNAYIEINGGHIELLNGMADMIVVRNIMDKDRTSGVLRGSSVRITGGTFVAHYAIDSDNDATAFIRNGDAPADTNKVLVSNTFKGNAEYDCEVTGGIFYGSWQRADNQRYSTVNGGNSDGLFVENTIAGFVSDGYQITGDATNGYSVTKK